uniref:Uncharacterized protein n=1 Tax=Amazona collaria TaxID=241587 RepID=A0A8B9GCD5_9PSIT
GAGLCRAVPCEEKLLPSLAAPVPSPGGGTRMMGPGPVSAAGRKPCWVAAAGVGQGNSSYWKSSPAKAEEPLCVCAVFPSWLYFHSLLDPRLSVPSD